MKAAPRFAGSSPTLGQNKTKVGLKDMNGTEELVLEESQNKTKVGLKAWLPV